jgi:hypothetical protein
MVSLQSTLTTIVTKTDVQLTWIARQVCFAKLPVQSEAADREGAGDGAQAADRALAGDRERASQENVM